MTTLACHRSALAFCTVSIALCVAFAAFFLCGLSAAIEAVDIASITVAADDDRLMAPSAVVAPCSVQILHRQSLPGSSGLKPDEVRCFTWLCENTVGDAASDWIVKSGLALCLSTRPFLPNSCLSLCHADQENAHRSRRTPKPIRRAWWIYNALAPRQLCADPKHRLHLLHYLENYRPHVAIEQIFLSTLAPYRALRRVSVSQISTQALKQAGAAYPRLGAHMFRHSIASTLLNEGLSLQTIATVLRHSSLESTRIYTKVDQALLQQVTLPWPEGE